MLLGVEERVVADRVPCEFFLIRYVPDVVKGEVREYRRGAAGGCRKRGRRCGWGVARPVYAGLGSGAVPGCGCGSCTSGGA